MYRSGLVNTLVNHANTKGFGLTSMSGVRRGFMPPQLKNKTNEYGTTFQKLMWEILETNSTSYRDFQRKVDKPMDKKL